MVFHEHLEEEDSENDSIEAVELGKIVEVTPVLDDKKQCITMSLRITGTDDVQLAAPPEPSRNLTTGCLRAKRIIVLAYCGVVIHIIDLFCTPN